MILHRFYDEKLAHASWMVGCSAAGEAVVVDPNRDVEPYLEAAEREGLRITHVTETHIHADFVSGARELAARTGARLHLSDAGPDAWKYAYAAESGAVLLRDGDSFSVGGVRLDAMHTPGHTPEHLCFVVTDTAAADAPVGVLSGDFVFVGDVGRPDLLERAARQAGTMEDGARDLHRSLRRFVETLPEYVQVWPAHGAGSACGKALGAVPTSTVGYERRFGWAFGKLDDEAGFVAEVLAGQPEPPMYFAEMKRINRDGPRILGGLSVPPRRAAESLDDALREGATVVDTRPGAAFAEGHVPGTLSVPMGKSFPTWAGSVVPYDRPFHLIADEERPDALRDAVRDLAMIGLDRVEGWFGCEAVEAWEERHGALARIDARSADEVAARHAAGEVAVVDVRGPAEYAAGHVPGALSVPLGRLPERLADLPRDVPLAVHCQSGARAGVALSVLQAAGFTDAVHLRGDWAGWSREGRPVET